MLEPSVAVKQSAIEFAHSGRTLNRKEGSSHSFWSYCLTTRLKQSNSSVAIAGCLQACHGFFFFLLLPLVGTGEGGQGWIEPDSLWFSLTFGDLMTSFHDSLSGTHFSSSKKEKRMDECMFWKWSKDSILSLRMYSENRKK